MHGIQYPQNHPGCGDVNRTSPGILPQDCDPAPTTRQVQVVWRRRRSRHHPLRPLQSQTPALTNQKLGGRNYGHQIPRERRHDPRQSPAYRTGRPRYNRGLHRIINSANAGAVAVVDCEGPQTGVSRETVRRWCLAEHLSRLPHKGGVIEFWCNGGEVAEQARRHHWERVRVGPIELALGRRCIVYCKGQGEFADVERWARVKRQGWETRVGCQPVDNLWHSC